MVKPEENRQEYKFDSLLIVPVTFSDYLFGID